MKLKVLVTLIAILALLTFGQAQSKPVTTGLQNGLFIENLNVSIPWKVVLDKPQDIGNPDIKEVTDKYAEVQWGEVHVLGGLKLNLKADIRKVREAWWLSHFYSFVDSASIETIKNHLDAYFGKQGKLGGEKKDAYFYQWRVENRLVRLGRFPAGERYGQYSGRFYFWLQRQQ